MCPSQSCFPLLLLLPLLFVSWQGQSPVTGHEGGGCAVWRRLTVFRALNPQPRSTPLPLSSPAMNGRLAMLPPRLTALSLSLSLSFSFWLWVVGEGLEELGEPPYVSTLRKKKGASAPVFGPFYFFCLFCVVLIPLNEPILVLISLASLNLNLVL